MNEKLSALLDGELSREESAIVLDEMSEDEQLFSEFSKFNLIRLAVRGQCSETQLRVAYRENVRFQPDVARKSSETNTNRRKRFSVSEYFQNQLWNRFGGVGFATGMAAALAIGFITHDLINTQISQQPNRTAAIAAQSAFRWNIPAIDETVKIEEHLNQSLLNLGDAANASRINSKTDALLVSYNDRTN